MYELNLKNTIWKFIKKVSNLNFALCVLLVVIIFCILGSVIEQEQDFSYYIENYFDYTSLILFFGLDHVFRTLWFTVSLIILLISLISCSFTNQLPSLKNSRRWKFIYKQKKTYESRSLLRSNHDFSYSYVNTLYSLLRMNFFVFCRQSSLYAYKGLFGRIAPIFVHFSIILVLLGSVYGSLCSFVLQENIPSGEVSHLKNLVYSGFYSSLRQDIFFRINNFYINYYDDGSIKQFFSNISFYAENKNPGKSQLIYVNNPLSFYKITFYQTNWEINSLRLRLGDDYIFQKKIFKKPSNSQVFWVSNLSTSKDTSIFFVLDSLDNIISIFNESGILIQKISVGQKFYLNSTPCIIDSIIPVTGLQLKSDPGLPIVYIGFFIMIISTFISYVSYSQIWVHLNILSLDFFGSTNRAKLFFQQDIDLINKIYDYYLVSSIILHNKVIKILR